MDCSLIAVVLQPANAKTSNSENFFIAFFLTKVGSGFSFAQIIVFLTWNVISGLSAVLVDVSDIAQFLHCAE